MRRHFGKGKSAIKTHANEHGRCMNIRLIWLQNTMRLESRTISNGLKIYTEHIKLLSSFTYLNKTFLCLEKWYKNSQMDLNLYILLFINSLPVHLYVLIERLSLPNMAAHSLQPKCLKRLFFFHWMGEVQH